MLSQISNPSAQIVLSLAVMLLAGFLMTRLTKLVHLPNVTGYILAGILIGPYVFKITPASLPQSMEFVTDIALAFIAFGVGKFFKLSKLKKNGKKVIVITIFEALVAAALITVSMMVFFHLSLSFSLLLGAIGSATAPASTLMTIRQYRAKGKFVNTILQVVALDDVVALIAFSVCAAVAKALSTEGGTAEVSTILLPILYNVLLLAAGGLGGLLLHKLIDKETRTNENRLSLVIMLLLSITGVCTYLDISPLLACMALGTVYINVGGNKKIFKQVNNFTPPILLLFFVLSGMRLDLTALATAGMIGVVYFVIRIVGKYAGAYFGALVSGAPKSVRNYLGLALVPQAGVSIGLAVLAQRILPEDVGTLLATIILSSGVLYEMVGPVCAKASLFLSHSIKGKRGSGSQNIETGVNLEDPLSLPREGIQMDAAEEKREETEGRVEEPVEK